MVMRADFLSRVSQWACECFGEEIAANRQTRNYRFLEEALELVQALECTKEDAHKLVDYVFGRPIGEPHQEMGGVLITLYALAAANGLEPGQAGWDEFNRINTPEIMAKIRAKQKNKLNPLDVLPALEAQNLRHSDDDAIDTFAAAMRDKMARSRAKWGNDWLGIDIPRLQVSMTDCVRKGDPIDVANYCMMLWHRGGPTKVVYGSQPPKLLDALAVTGIIEEHAPNVVSIPDEVPYHMNRSGNVAVSDDTYYNPMSTCPRNAKVLLLGPHGVATLGVYDGDPQWRGWFPLPKERK